MGGGIAVLPAVNAEPPAPTWSIAFLVYDARSGSTLLAELLTRRLEGVYVTPEIAFLEFLKTGPRRSVHVGRLADSRRLSSENFVRNLGLDADQLQQCIAALPPAAPKSVILRELLRAHMAAAGIEAPRCVVVKHGIHVRVWRKIVAAFGAEARFIHIHRDPRAVINSKLRTTRPYRPYETMAWYGPMVAAWRWRSYSRAMRAAKAEGAAVLDISYERLLDDPDEEISKIAAFLGMPVRPSAAHQPSAYRIPVSEQSIHKLVHSGRVHQERSSAWHAELTTRDLRVIESVACSEMTARGYRPSCSLSIGERRMAVAAELPRAAVALLRHAWRRISSAAPTHVRSGATE